MHAIVLGGCKNKGNGIGLARHQLLLGRVAFDPRTLLGNCGVTVLADPVGARAQFGVSKHVKQRHLDNCRVEELRTLGDCRANEEATLAAANDSKPAWTRDFAADQVLGNGSEIIPCLLLRCPLSGLVPLWAKLAAPAQVSNDIGIALFEP